MPPRAVWPGLVTQRRSSWSGAKWTGVETEVQPAFARSGKDADRESILSGVNTRELVRRTRKIIWYSVSVQLATGPVQPGKVCGETDDLPASDEDRFEHPGRQQVLLRRRRLVDQFLIEDRSSRGRHQQAG